MSKIWKETSTRWCVSVQMPGNGIRIQPSECLGYYDSQQKCSEAINKFWKQVQKEQKVNTPHLEMVHKCIIIALRMHIKTLESITHTKNI